MWVRPIDGCDGRTPKMCHGNGREANDEAGAERRVEARVEVERRIDARLCGLDGTVTPTATAEVDDDDGAERLPRAGADAEHRAEEDLGESGGWCAVSASTAVVDKPAGPVMAPRKGHRFMQYRLRLLAGIRFFQ